MVVIKIKKLNADAIIPYYAKPGDAGMDVFSNENVSIKPGERVAVRTGISCALPSGYAALVWDKSGIALKSGLKTMGGVMDATYRGEYQIILHNLSLSAVDVSKGQKIAQLLIKKVESADVLVVDELDQTVRGSDGFGSTGLSKK